MIDERTIVKQLNTRWLGKSIRVFDTIDSTSDYLIGIARTSPERGLVVVADEQTRGRGRFGRRWFSPRGSGVWMSLMIGDIRLSGDSPALSLAVASCIYDAIKSLYNIDLTIKWPNDLIYENRKLAGILLESVIGRDLEKYVICGIGINTDLSDVDIPIELGANIISLAEITDAFVERDILISEILNNLEFILDSLRDGSLNIRALLFGKDCLVGRRVRWYDNHYELTGTISGFREDGALILNCEEKEHCLVSGSIDIFI